MRGFFRFHERTVKLVLLALTFLLSSKSLRSNRYWVHRGNRERSQRGRDLWGDGDSQEHGNRSYPGPSPPTKTAATNLPP